LRNRECADSQAGKRAALDQLGGEVFGTLATVGFQNTSNWLGSVGSRLRPNGGRLERFSVGIVRTNGAIATRLIA
jgi:uncharacterized protein with beta-barrel porin domain